MDTQKYMSKIMIGTNTYYLKDAEARELISTISSLNFSLSTNASNTPLGVTWKNSSGQIINGTLQASSDTQNKIYLVPISNSTVSELNNYNEYVTIRIDNNYSWELLGDNQAIIENLGDLAYKDTVEVKYNATNATTEKASITPEGTVDNQAITPKGKIALGNGTVNYSPEGTINASFVGTEQEFAFKGVPIGQVSTPTITLATDKVSVIKDYKEDQSSVVSTFKGTSSSINYTNSRVKSIDAHNYTPSGTISTPVLTVTPTKEQIIGISDVGTLPTFKEGTFSAGELPSFDATVSSDGKLSFNWSAGSLPNKQTDKFTSGSLPTIGSQTEIITNVDVVSNTPIFSGNEVSLTHVIQQEDENNTISITPKGTISNVLNLTFDKTDVYDDISATSSDIQFTGEEMGIAGTIKPSGSVSATFKGKGVDLEFQGTEEQHTHTFTGKATEHSHTIDTTLTEAEVDIE